MYMPSVASGRIRRYFQSVTSCKTHLRRDLESTWLSKDKRSNAPNNQVNCPLLGIGLALAIYTSVASTSTEVP